MSLPSQNRDALGMIVCALGSGIALVALLLPMVTLGGAWLGGLVVGTIFGQATLAAVWAALGPFRVAHRLPLVATWLWLLLAAISLAALAMPTVRDDAILIAVAMLVQWGLAALVIWSLSAVTGWRVAQVGSGADELHYRPLQFSIRQIMVLTVAVAIALGVGRASLARIEWARLLLGAVSVEGPVFLLIVLLNVAATVPLAFGALAPRNVLLACCPGLVLIAGISWLELPLIRGLISSTRPDLAILLWSMNLCQAAWVLGVLLTLERAGYRLAALPWEADSPAVR